MSAGYNMQALRRSTVLQAPALLSAFLLVGSGITAGAATFVTFDPPGSEATYGGSITDADVISGSYYDGSVYHGYIRAADESFTTFDPKGSIDTFAFGIN